jgi:hypothetical protein
MGPIEKSNETIPDEVRAADDRTLRLSSLDVTPEDVEGFITYQRTLRDELEFSPVCHAGWTEQLSAAHQRSLAESKMDPGRLARVTSIALDFCARRSSAKTLRARLDDLRGADAETQEVAARLRTELRRLDDLGTLERRHGASQIAALKEREDELVALHEQLSPLLAR